MQLARLRCYWSRPLGHGWELVTDQSVHLRRCRRCGKTVAVRRSGGTQSFPAGHRGDYRHVGDYGGGDYGGGDYGGGD